MLGVDRYLFPFNLKDKVNIQVLDSREEENNNKMQSSIEIGERFNPVNDLASSLAISKDDYSSNNLFEENIIKLDRALFKTTMDSSYFSNTQSTANMPAQSFQSNVALKKAIRKDQSMQKSKSKLSQKGSIISTNRSSTRNKSNDKSFSNNYK